MKINSKNKAQISAQFAWIFILIAGAIILIFFISIVFKQKEISDTKLSANVLSQLETIFTGAGLSSGTINIIDMPETELNFICDEDSYSEFAIKGTSLSKQTPTQPIFSPDTIKGRQILAWTLSWEVPFKVTNFLYLTDPGVNYVFFSPDSETAKELKSDLPIEFSIQNVENLNEVSTQGFHSIKIIFFDNTNIIPSLPETLQNKDIDVSALKITYSDLTFYERNRADLRPSPISISYLDAPSAYAAIFSQDQISYECNMKKAFRRLNYVSQIYESRKEELKNSFATSEDCYKIYNSDNSFSLIKEAAASCTENIKLNCIPLIEQNKYKLQSHKDYLNINNCPEIY